MHFENVLVAAYSKNMETHLQGTMSHNKAKRMLCVNKGTGDYWTVAGKVSRLSWAYLLLEVEVVLVLVLVLRLDVFFLLEDGILLL